MEAQGTFGGLDDLPARFDPAAHRHELILDEPPSSPAFFDPATDSMYVRLSNADAHDQEVHDDRDLVVDRDAAGAVVGFDFQHASEHQDAIAEALAALRKAAGRQPPGDWG